MNGQGQSASSIYNASSQHAANNMQGIYANESKLVAAEAIVNQLQTRAKELDEAVMSLGRIANALISPAVSPGNCASTPLTQEVSPQTLEERLRASDRTIAARINELNSLIQQLARFI